MDKFSRTLCCCFHFSTVVRDLGLGFYSNQSGLHNMNALRACGVNSDALYTTCGRVTVAMEISLWTHLIDNDVFHMWIFLLKEYEVMP